MWGTFLSEPLPIVAPVGRYPAGWLIGRMPTRDPRVFRPRDAPQTERPVLRGLSADCPGDAERLHTRYSPVRRSPSVLAS